MIITITYFLASLFSIIAGLKNNKYLKASFIFAAFLIILLPLAFRHELVGIDTFAYYKIFEVINHEFDPLSDLRYESGYTFLNLVVYNLGGTAISVIFISAIASLSPFFYIIYKYSTSFIASLSILCGLGFYGFMYNGVRQAIAMGLVLISFHLIIKNKIIFSVLLIYLASLFHFTALFFYTAYFITKIRLNFLFSLLIWLFSLIFMIHSVSNFFFNYLSLIFPSNYLSYIEAGTTEASFRVKFIANQLICILLLYFILVRKKYNIDKTSLSFLYITFFGFILNNITTHMAFLERISLYFTMFSVITLPYIAKFILNKKSFYIFTFILYTTYSFFYLRGLEAGSNGIIPYSSIWDKNI